MDKAICWLKDLRRKNIIVLIGGASHTGKTRFAQQLLDTYGYPYLSIDHLKIVFIRRGNTHLSPNSDDEALTGYHYIQSHFDDIKRYAGVIAQRGDDADFTIESAFQQNGEVLEMCRNHGVDYLLIDDDYDVDTPLRKTQSHV